MSMHPNTMLLAILKPKYTGECIFEKIWNQIADEDGEEGEYGELYLRNSSYKCINYSKDSYLEDYQIELEEGEVAIFDMVTYGYSDKTEWNKVEQQKKELEEWLVEYSNKIDFSFVMYLSANLW